MKLPLHREYIEHMCRWERCRDAQAGGDHIKRKRELYLPKPAAMQGYDHYIKRVVFPEITAQTAGGLLGMVFRLASQCAVPSALETMQIPGSGVVDFLKNCDMDGNTFDELAKWVVAETINPGRVGILVDSNENRPYCVKYKAEDILNWAETVAPDGKKELTLLILREHFNEAIDGEPYATSPQRRFKVWQKTLTGVTVATFQPKRDGKPGAQPAGTLVTTAMLLGGLTKETDNVEKVSEVTPSFRGRPLDVIPFVFFNASSLDCCVQSSPLQGVVDENIGLYQLMADYKHALHNLAMPVPVMTGPWQVPEGGKIVFDADNVLFSADPTSKFTFAEPPKFEALRTAIKDSLDLMASLGASLLTARPRQAETSEVAKIHAGKQGSPLTNTVTTISLGLTHVLQLAAHWLLADESACVYELNSDFVESDMDGREMLALSALYQAHAMSLKSMIWNFKRHELMPPDQTVEQEIADIKSEALADQQQQAKLAAQQQQSQLELLHASKPQQGQPGQPAPKPGDAQQ